MELRTMRLILRLVGEGVYDAPSDCKSPCFPIGLNGHGLSN